MKTTTVAAFLFLGLCFAGAVSKMIVNGRDPSEVYAAEAARYATAPAATFVCDWVPVEDGSVNTAPGRELLSVRQ